MPRWSRRSGREPRLNRLARALHDAGNRPLLDLTESNPTRAGLPYPAAELRAALGLPGALGYEPHPRGMPEARRALAAHAPASSAPLDPERLLFTCSTSEAYSFLFKLLCDPGDEVLAPRPSYPLIEDLARLEGVRVRPYSVHYDGQWYISPDEVAALVTTDTRAIMAVSPNNPTGSYLKPDELRGLAHPGLPLVVDEVFASYPLREGAPHPSALACRETLVFTLGGLSKLAGLPQLKLAWTAIGGPDEAVRRALERLELIADTFLSPNTPVQVALERLLGLYPPIHAAIGARCRHNLRTLGALSDAHAPLDLLPPEGGWYAVLRVPSTLPDEDWALEVLEHCNVRVHPGYLFDFPSGEHLVLSLLAPPETFAEGARRMCEYIAMRA